jgi:hypothetical protein
VKNRSSPLPVVLVVVWALLLIAFMALRPRPREPLFWVLLVPAFITGGGYMIVSYVASRRTMAEVADWYKRLSEVVDVQDFEDDGHLHEQFDPDERERLIAELKRMPPGTRNLRKALATFAPELLERDA